MILAAGESNTVIVCIGVIVGAAILTGIIYAIWAATRPTPKIHDEIRETEAVLAKERAWGAARRTDFRAGEHVAGIVALALILAAVGAFTGYVVLVAVIGGAVLSPWLLYVVVRSAVEGALASRLDGIAGEVERTRAKVDALAGQFWKRDTPPMDPPTE